ncbi:MAG TPA: low molecular weight protein-tyrosine-phosphatase [Bacteroidales bacterium]|nr:low molecular weight protein-tyrosine-phosphatase [Bacteroidales bacterium]HSA42736.1 low molecular weight protein-tyrosine-phosphatase [Bacteroidales bacterium]
MLFVCLGNICRSPMAEGLMRHKIMHAGLGRQVQVDSAGFESFHFGDPPDARAMAVCRQHGIDISSHRARPFRPEDFDVHEMIYVMDSNNYTDVIAVSRNQSDRAKVDFLMNAVNPGSKAAVPDPWYGGRQDFEKVYCLLDEATDCLLKLITRKLGDNE